MIYLLWPTARPAQFKTTHKYWYDKANTPNAIKTLVAVDTEAEKELLCDYDVIVVKKDCPGVAYVSYALSSKVIAENSDIIILASDDFFPPDKWDIWVTEQLREFDGCLLVNDGYQQGGCVTIPIMSYNCLQKLNKIIYHPSYRHQYSDAELWLNLNEMGLLRNLRGQQYPTFEHKHWANGKRELDEVDQRSNSAGWYDSTNYNNRCRMLLSERLKVCQG